MKKTEVPKCRYYIAVLCRIAQDDTVEYVGNFNLKERSRLLESSEQKNHNVELSNHIVNFEKCMYYEKEDVCVIRLHIIKDKEQASKVRDGETTRPIHLKENEYFGEKISVLYDCKKKLLMFPQNNSNFRIEAFREWINQIAGINEEYITFASLNGRKKGLTVRKAEFQKLTL